MVFLITPTYSAFEMGYETSLKVWNLEKNHITSLSGGILTRKSIFSMINFLSPYAICIIKFSFRPILRQKKFAENRKNWRNFFASKSAEMKILLCKWYMAIKSYLKIFFIYYWKIWLPSQNYPGQRGFVIFLQGPYLLKCFIPHFKCTIGRCNQKYHSCSSCFSWGWKCPGTRCGHTILQTCICN